MLLFRTGFGIESIDTFLIKKCELPLTLPLSVILYRAQINHVTSTLNDVSYTINTTDIVAPIRNLYIKSPKSIGVQQLNTLLSDLDSLEQLTLSDFELNDIDQYMVEKSDTHFFNEFDQHPRHRITRDVAEFNVSSLAADFETTTLNPTYMTTGFDNFKIENDTLGETNVAFGDIVATESSLPTESKDSTMFYEPTTTDPLLDIGVVSEIKPEDIIPEDIFNNKTVDTKDTKESNNFDIDMDGHSNDVNTENRAIIVLDDNALNFARILPNLKLLRLKAFVNESVIPNVIFQIIHGLKNLEYLELSSNNFQHIPSNALSFCGSTLKKLYLYKNSITDIHEDAFQNLTNLEVLDLSHNYLEHLPDYTLKPLKHLLYLSLKSNKFDNLSEYMFQANSKLVSLDLSQNSQLRPLPANLLHGLNNLANFSLAYCNMSTVSTNFKNFLHNVPNLSKLDLKANQMKNLTLTGLFAWNRKLSKIDFSSNQITQISKAIFSVNSSALTELNLDKNRITHLPENLFSNSRNIRKLSMSSNKLTEISPVTFIQLRLLEEVDFSRNQITTINTQINQLPFGIGGYLRKINLSNNRLANFESDIFDINWRLYLSISNLDLRNNNFTGALIVPIFVASKEHTINLDVSNNNFSTVNIDNLVEYMSFKDVHSREVRSWETHVRLDNNPIRCDCFLFPFLNYTKTTGRFFDKNYFHSILRKTLFIIDSTNELTCNGPKPMIGRSLSNLKLEELICQIDEPRICPPKCHCIYRSVDECAIVDCDNSGLEDLPNELELFRYYNISLKETHLKINYVDSVILQLRNNSIRSLQGLSSMFVKSNRKFHTPTFVEVFLDHNNITSIEGNLIPEQSLNSTPLLRTLSLRDNFLESMPLDFLKNIESHSLRLGYVDNKTETFPKYDRMNRAVESKIYLSGNPLDCYNEPMLPGSECYIRELKTWLSSHQNMVGDINLIQCDNRTLDMERIKDTNSSLILVNISDDILCSVLIPPHSNSALMALSVICVVLASSLFVVSILYYRNKQTILAFIYIHLNPIFICLSFTEDDLDEDKIYDAFVSYSSSDRDIVMELIEKLEKPQDMSEVSLILQNGTSIHEGKVDQIVPENEFKKSSTLKSSKEMSVEDERDNDSQYRLCIHERDWLPGNLISWNIVNSVQNSKRTILVLSQSFIQSIWFQVEFHTAYYQMLEDKMDRLIVIVRGELPPKDQLDKDLNFLLTTKTYLVWGEKWFWEKLYYAMPHKKKQKEGTKEKYLKNNISTVTNGKNGMTNNGSANGVNYKDGMLKWSSTYSSPKNGKAEAMKDYVDKTIASHFQLNQLTPSPTLLNSAVQKQQPQSTPTSDPNKATMNAPKSLRNSGTLSTATTATLQAFQKNGGYDNKSFINETNT